jgi:hypothetical protein
MIEAAEERREHLRSHIADLEAGVEPTHEHRPARSGR